MKLQCIECGRRIDIMSRNAWRWFNEAQSLFICHKHIMDANLNGLDDPRLNEIQENEAELKTEKWNLFKQTLITLNVIKMKRTKKMIINQSLKLTLIITRKKMLPK
jgi:hypothetical protein